MVAWFFFYLFVSVLADNDSKSIQFRMFYGQDVRIEDYPFFAGLENCGAVILSDIWILTAAHCVASSRPQKIVWVGGESYENSIQVPYNKVIVHKGFMLAGEAALNDLALIKLSVPLKFSTKIQPIGLPYNGFTSSRLVIVGRGMGETGQISQKLQKLDLIRLTTEECMSLIPKKTLDEIGSENVEFLKKTNICAKRETDMPTICIGDSGSPLVSNNTLVGIDSYIESYDCAESRLGFYVKLQYYLPWIRKHTGL